MADLHNFKTHRDAWRNALVLSRDEASERSEDPEADRSYWNHEIKAYDEAMAELDKLDPVLADNAIAIAEEAFHAAWCAASMYFSGSANPVPSHSEAAQRAWSEYEPSERAKAKTR